MQHPDIGIEHVIDPRLHHFLRWRRVLLSHADVFHMVRIATIDHTRRLGEPIGIGGTHELLEFRCRSPGRSPKGPSETT